MRPIDHFMSVTRKIMAARCAIKEGADVLVTLDADNFTGPDFEEFVTENLEPGTFLCPDHASIRGDVMGAGSGASQSRLCGQAGGAGAGLHQGGRLRRDLRYLAGRGHRLQRAHGTDGLHAEVHPTAIWTIPHGGEVRFKEYPHARQFDQVGAWKIDGHDTDYGGELWTDRVRDGRTSWGERFELKPVPTRIFGIGMHKTATTSFHKAFQILGFDSLHWGKG